MTAIIPTQCYNPPDAAVTLVTALAQTQDITDADYAAIYARAAQGRSLRNIELALKSGVSFGWWAKYWTRYTTTGESILDRDRKNELRRWARENGGPDLPDLPLTPAEAIAGRVHPDAAVYQVGAAIASRVILVGADIPAATLLINGHCQIVAETPTLDAPQDECNGRYSGQLDPTHRRYRPAYFRPCLSRNAAERIPQLEALLIAAQREIDTP